MPVSDTSKPRTEIRIIEGAWLTSGTWIDEATIFTCFGRFTEAIEFQPVDLGPCGETKLFKWCC